MSVRSWDTNLSAEQAGVASYSGSHVRLLAGPGTGKTHTLAGRVAYLVTQEQVSPSSILVLTFTRLATRELRSAIGKKLDGMTDEMPHISTLHSFALRQLLRNASVLSTIPQPLRIADDWEEATVINEEMKAILGWHVDLVRKEFTLMASDWNSLRVERGDHQGPKGPFVGALLEHRQVYGYTLRSELIYLLKRALTQAPGFELEPRFSHVLIDEYQDLNPCDLAIAEALTKRGAFLMACGDDDQSIYGFRHADPSGIRNFLDDYDGAVSLELTECWRCGSNVLETSSWVASQDPQRVPKSLHAAAANPPGSVNLLSFANGTEEVRGIARLVSELQATGVDPGEILNLIRSDNSEVYSTPVRSALERLGVPVTVSTDNKTILDERYGRRALSLLRLISNSSDDLAWRSLLETHQGIGANTLRAIYAFAKDRGIRYSEALSQLTVFSEKISAAPLRKLQEVIRAAESVIQDFAFTQEDVREDGEDWTPADLCRVVVEVASIALTEDEDRIQVIQHLSDLIDQAGAATISELLISVAVGRDDRGPQLDKGAVNILTMHQAKGLSADAVVIMAAEDQLIPSRQGSAEIADDLRLLYVSMTRARQRLFITYAGRRSGQQQHTGRDRGNPVRTLTRFLADSSMQVERGVSFTIL